MTERDKVMGSLGIQWSGRMLAIAGLSLMVACSADVDPASQEQDASWAHEQLAAMGYLPNDALAEQFQGWQPVIGTAPANAKELDESSRAALRAFQKDRSLPVTGELDDGTLTAMAEPRCGVPASSVSIEDKWAIGAFPKIADRALTWMLANTDDSITREKVLPGIQLAGLSWEGVTNLTWRHKSADALPDFMFLFSDLGPDVAGQALGWIDGIFQIRFNTRVSWTTDLIQGVALHEIGHAIGLHHSSHPSASMYPSASHFGTGAPTRALHPEDVVPANLMYGEWESIPGTAKDIAVAPFGTVWKITDTKVSKWVESTRTWQDIPGNLGGIAIDVDSSNKPWIVATNNLVYSLNTANNTWTRIDEAGGICDIGAGPAGAIYVAGCLAGFWRWKGNVLGSDWESMLGVPAAKVDVDPLGRPWIVTKDLPGAGVPAGSIQRLNNGSWETLPGSNSVDIGLGGQVGVVGAPASVFPWRASGARAHAFSEQGQVGVVGGSSSIQGSFEWISSESLPWPLSPNRVSTGPNGAAWVVTSGGTIYRRSRY